MPRLRNVKTGAVVNVSDSTAATLSGYEPAEQKKATASKSSAKSSTSEK